MQDNHSDGYVFSLEDFFDDRPNYPIEPELIELSRRSESSPPENVEINLDIPFVHQLWDTPADFNGSWACGAACALMVIAYYELLKPKPIEINVKQVPKHTSEYGWYMSNEFIHDGHSFKLTSEAPINKQRTKTYAGIYGTVLDYHGEIVEWGTAAADLNENGRGLRKFFDCFLPKVGNGISVRIGLREKKRNNVESLITKTLDEGHPVIISTKLFGLHHIVVIRGYYIDKKTDIIKWIVNDPYGYQTDASFDGANVVYEYDELKPKWMVLFSGAHNPKNNEI